MGLPFNLVHLSSLYSCSLCFPSSITGLKGVVIYTLMVILEVKYPFKQVSIIHTSSAHTSLCFLSLISVPLCVSAGGSAVLHRPALQLQPPHSGLPHAEAPLLRERPKEGPPEADPHDDRRPLRPQWTHCDWGRHNKGLPLDTVSNALTMKYSRCCRRTWERRV